MSWASRHLFYQGGGGPKYQVPAEVTGTPIEENSRKNEPPADASTGQRFEDTLVTSST